MIKMTQDKLDHIIDKIKLGCSARDVFSYDNLSGLDFKDCDLRNVSFIWSDLRGADLSSTVIDQTTSFEYAIFDENTKMPFVQSVCPEEGPFIGYKKAITIYGQECIVKLLIPEDAKRSSGLGPKCRCDKAIVFDIESIGIEPAIESAVVSLYDRSFFYRIGETVKVEDFDECRWHLCAPGIHFYMEPALAILH